MRVWPRRARLLGKFGNNVDEGFVILPGGADRLEDVVCDKDGKVFDREYEIRVRVDLSHTEGDSGRGPVFAQEQYATWVL